MKTLRFWGGGARAAAQALLRGFGIFAGSVVLMRNFGDLMAI